MQTNNTGPAGFWSYTHRDDEIDEGRIKRLAKKIANEFEGITAEELHVFLDKNDIKWGDEWRNRIDTALTGSTFFMPIVTPRFFKSEECRREILTFAGHAKSLGLEELLLPILYFDVPKLREPNPSDEVVALVAQRQYENWTDLRLMDEESPEYRQAVHRLANRLVEILERAAEVESPPIHSLDGIEADEEPGMLELMADTESALPRWAEVMQEFVETITEIGESVKSANEEMERSDARGSGFAGRLRITQDLAKEITAPVDRMGDLGNQYSAELVKIDPGVLRAIRLVELEGITPGQEEKTNEFFDTIKNTAYQMRIMVGGAREFADSLEGASGLSKSMRPLVRKMRGALQQIVDGQAVLDEWERRIEEVQESSN
ncbi:toll/interleukin-1 receptor domain-containing protein [Streptomyces phaeochromogenes]|uniref:Toll/interleukin-1 receptor domain-containing protein n=2 Tax=Streptomyces phaeochromogenes TaxID=1923 RepID=A0ABZ1HB76_STRPH|nr:toll/interleukin-1 receptor domain-containing protein [Streptomyces phaeochromogenes]WSD15838.1 toll/interleukin-1 receptor domain-containing protein [Streptomyces phaeochromogenes]